MVYAIGVTSFNSRIISDTCGSIIIEKMYALPRVDFPKHVFLQYEERLIRMDVVFHFPRRTGARIQPQ